MIGKTFTLILALFLIVVPCIAQEISDAEFIAKGDAARYNAIAFKDNTVAWIEYGKDAENMLTSSILKYDISTGMQETVIADPSGKFSLDFSGDRYVWSDQRGIFLYDESKGELTFLYSRYPQHSPAISGDIIVWEEKTDDERSRIMVYNIGTGEYTEIPDGYLVSSYYPAISGDTVAYIKEDLYDNSLHLCLYDINDGAGCTFIAQVPDVHQPPAIDRDIVVWTGKYNDFYTTMMYDINTGEISPVSPTESAQLCPDVSGRHVVWLDFGDCPGNLPWGGRAYLHSLDTKSTEKIPSGHHVQNYPKISGDYVIWLDYWNYNRDIYLYSFLDLGRDFFSGSEGSTSDATPTPLPTPGTKIRFYSTIGGGETDWYSLTPKEKSQLYFELRWNCTDTELSLSVVSPSGSIWHFTDTDDKKDDSAVRMTILKTNSRLYDSGKWTVAVSGDRVPSEADYDICWY